MKKLVEKMKPDELAKHAIRVIEGIERETKLNDTRPTQYHRKLDSFGKQAVEIAKQMNKLSFIETIDLWNNWNHRSEFTMFVDIYLDPNF